MSQPNKHEFARRIPHVERESTLIPMLIGGLSLALVGMLIIVMIV